MAGSRARIAWGRLFLLTALLFAVVMFGTGAGFVLGVLRDLPTLQQAGDIITARSSVIYDRNNVPVLSLHDEQNREVVRLAQFAKNGEGIPKVLQDAVVAIEDHEFYEHRGINPKALLRAAWVILTRRGFQGGSTITQQLAKNTFLTPEVTIRRKLQEMWYAIQLERRYTKEEILEFYLNKIYFGEGAYGAQAASKVHFGKDVWKLDLAEAALLAGIIQAPEALSPHTHWAAAKARQTDVLDAMARYGYITPAEAEKAKKEPIHLANARPQAAGKGVGFWFIDHVRRELLERFGKEKLYQGGLKIYTTLDREMQQAAEESVRQLDKFFAWRPGQFNQEAAAVFMEAKTGYVRAIVGGRRPEGQLVHNRAVTPSQPGSTIKPLAVYAPALEAKVVTPGTVFDDAPYYPPYRGGLMWPDNWDFKFLGLVTVRDALKLSINTVAVKTVERIGPERAFESVKAFGVSSLVESGPQSDKGNYSLALGGLTRGISPLEMAAAYTAFANLGERVKPITILKVLGPDDEVLLKNETKRYPVLSRETAWLLVDMMKDVIEEGTGGPARLQNRRVGVAGKTGSSENWADVWWVGYTPEIVGSVWVGYDDHRRNDSIIREGGGFWALRIWKQAMEEIVKRYPRDTDWPRPPTLRAVNIDRKSGKRPGPWTPKESIVTEWFRPGTEPEELDDVHVPAIVTQEDPKLLWDPLCVGAQPVQKVFLKRPPYRPGSLGQVPADAKDALPTKSCRDDPRFRPSQPGAGTPPATPAPPGVAPPQGGSGPAGAPPSGSAPPGTVAPPGPGTGPPSTSPPAGAQPGDGGQRDGGQRDGGGTGGRGRPPTGGIWDWLRPPTRNRRRGL